MMDGMARMLGEAQGSHCPSCHDLPGVDCADKGTSTRHQKRIEKREWTAEAFTALVDEVAERWRPALDELGQVVETATVRPPDEAEVGL